jgi:hypothetical protein
MPVCTECTQDGEGTLGTSILYRVFFTQTVGIVFVIAIGKWFWLIMSECFVTETLGTNPALSKESLLDGWHKCFIYCTVCSIPTTLELKPSVERKKCIECFYVNTRD